MKNICEGVISEWNRVRDRSCKMCRVRELTSSWLRFVLKDGTSMMYVNEERTRKKLINIRNACALLLYCAPSQLRLVDSKGSVNEL